MGEVKVGERVGRERWAGKDYGSGKVGGTVGEGKMGREGLSSSGNSLIKSWSWTISNFETDRRFLR